MIPHKEALNIVNKFMDDSGIRDYCKTQCTIPTKCCGGCWNSDEDCNGYPDRLPCAGYACLTIINRLPTTLGKILYKLVYATQVKFYNKDNKPFFSFTGTRALKENFTDYGYINGKLERHPKKQDYSKWILKYDLSHLPELSQKIKPYM